MLLPVPALVWVGADGRRTSALELVATKLFQNASELVGRIAAGCSQMGLVAMLCFFKHRALPFEVCEPNWALGIMGSLCVVSIVCAAIGVKRCRWTTILCAVE